MARERPNEEANEAGESRQDATLRRAIVITIVATGVGALVYFGAHIDLHAAIYAGIAGAGAAIIMLVGSNGNMWN